MKKNDKATDLFARSSVTYFYSSLFFPENIRSDITKLYAYVRTADNFVDKIPPDSKAFFAYCDSTEKSLAGSMSGNTIIDDFVKLSKKYGFDRKWISAFLDAMRQDLNVKRYSTYDELARYMYGSAEVVGLMIGRILGLPADAVGPARIQGRAMQFINFIRDVAEDLDLGRIYIPEEDMRKFGVVNLPPQTANESEAFCRLIRYEIDIYRNMQNDAAAGYRYIPWRYRVAVRTAAEMYRWTSKVIYQDPMVIFRRKVKPTKLRVIAQALVNLTRFVLGIFILSNNFFQVLLRV